MKKLIFLLTLIALQISFAQTWEPTSWQSEPNYRLFNTQTEAIVIVPSWNDYPHRIIRLTTDNGINWTKLKLDSMQYSIIEPFIIKDFIGVPYQTSKSFGCFVSKDFGKTWIKEINGINLEGKKVKIHKAGNSIFAFIYGPSESGLLRSTDEGGSWEIKTSSLGNADFIGFAQSDQYTIVQTSASTYISSNFGDTWDEINNPPISADSIRLNGNKLYAFEVSYSPYKFVFYTSADLGKTWIDLKNNISADNHPRRYGQSKNDIYFMNYNESEKKTGLLISIDNGLTWQNKNFEEPRSYQYDMDMSIGNRIIYYNQKGIWISSEDGANWKKSENGLPLNVDYEGVIIKTGKDLYTNFGNKIYRSIDTGSSWELWHSGIYDYFEVSDLVSIKDTLLASAHKSLPKYGGMVFYSTDNGVSWNTQNFNPELRDGYSMNRIYAGEGNVIVKTMDSAYITKDNGASWKEISQVWPNNPKVDYAVFHGGLTYTGSLSGGIKESNSESDVWVERNNGLPDIAANKLYDLRKADGLLYAHVGDAYYISSDKGLNWDKRNNGIEPIWGDSVCFDAKENEVYISHQKRLYYTNDNGLNWTKRDLSAILNNIDDFVYAIKIVDNKVIISLLESGLFISSDKGISWNELNSGLENDLNKINFLEVTKDYLFCSKTNAMYTLHHDLVYLYRMKRSDLGISEPEKKTQNGFSIFPNPASDYLQVKDYEGGATEFSVTNIFGNTILSGSYTGGRLEISSLPAGTYFLRLGDRVNAFVKI